MENQITLDDLQPEMVQDHLLRVEMDRAVEEAHKAMFLNRLADLPENPGWGQDPSEFKHKNGGYLR